MPVSMESKPRNSGRECLVRDPSCRRLVASAMQNTSGYDQPPFAADVCSAVLLGPRKVRLTSNLRPGGVAAVDAGTSRSRLNAVPLSISDPVEFPVSVDWGRAEKTVGSILSIHRSALPRVRRHLSLLLNAGRDSGVRPEAPQTIFQRPLEPVISRRLSWLRGPDKTALVPVELAQRVQTLAGRTLARHKTQSRRSLLSQHFSRSGDRASPTDTTTSRCVDITSS